ncbi:unnamed protein product [Effrenium voratum]|uniref:peptidylprolyl isomerase n=1 Tax=Effrenium voratum TaxID=2562239 RepID=A0AA36IVM7_9DINO|nr:unnamed protein product [Effrenium voratum]
MARERSPRRVPAAEDPVQVTTLRPGDGKTFPKQGDQLVMHYAGSLDVTHPKEKPKVFDSSYSRNKPFQFRIGVGEVIRGWDEAILKMSLGEKASLRIGSQKAFGKEGSGRVPPNSDLNYEVELLRIN